MTSTTLNTPRAISLDDCVLNGDPLLGVDPVTLQLGVTPGASVTAVDPVNVQVGVTAGDGVDPVPLNLGVDPVQVGVTASDGVDPVPLNLGVDPVQVGVTAGDGVDPVPLNLGVDPVIVQVDLDPAAVPLQVGVTPGAGTEHADVNSNEVGANLEEFSKTGGFTLETVARMENGKTLPHFLSHSFFEGPPQVQITASSSTAQSNEDAEAISPPKKKLRKALNDARTDSKVTIEIKS